LLQRLTVRTDSQTQRQRLAVHERAALPRTRITGSVLRLTAGGRVVLCGSGAVCRARTGTIRGERLGAAGGVPVVERSGVRRVHDGWAAGSLR